MKTLEIGTHVWVSRFNSTSFDEFIDFDGELIEPRKKRDIFHPPVRYVIRDCYLTDKNQGKWFVDLIASAENPSEHLNDVITDGTSSVLAASLSEYRDLPEMLSYEIKIGNGVVETHDDYLISRKKSKNLQFLGQKMKKLHKKFKNTNQYTNMSVVMSCIMDIKTPCQLQRMIDCNPEYFV